MRRRFALALACGLLLTAAARPADPPRPTGGKQPPGLPGAAVEVPYRLTDTKHVMVRLKVNGKGPFNMILDTGAPAVFLATAAAKKAGLAAGADGWAKPDTFVLEGGLKVPDAKLRIDDPFQLQGMNKIGLAGVEVHGMIGYTVLARYRVEYDLTADKLRFEPLAFDPPDPVRIDKDKAADKAQYDAMVNLTKLASMFFGAPNFDTVPRGFLGIELDNADGAVVVKKVLPGSPAEKAGLKPGDRIEAIKTTAVADDNALAKALAKAGVGSKLTVKVKRGAKTEELTIELGRGL